jgi:lipopolysaccharide/colanic/teichoic acid biosynthesis glycosyltransferase
MIKRAFDILLSFIGLCVLLPVFAVVALLIKLDSKGPVFYRQIRVGRDGKPFQILKFRTMKNLKHWTGTPLSPRNDPRVTTIGAVLRRLKVNEFPQLINVIRGDMSFIGPRPEVPEFVEYYTDEQKRVLAVRPGIVGPSQILMRNEEELFENGVDPKVFYVQNILPEKLRIDLEYVENSSFLGDVQYLAKGVIITIAGAITSRHLFENAEQIAAFFCDIFVCSFSYFLAYFLRMEGNIPAAEKTILFETLPFVTIVRMFAFLYMGLYSTLVRFISYDDVVKIMKGVGLSSAFIVLMTFFAGERGHPRSVFVIDALILTFLVVGYRLALKAMRGGRKEDVCSDCNVLIYGAEEMGDIALRYLKMEGERRVIAFVDDDPKKMRKRIHGLKVLGNRYDIEALAGLYQIDAVLVAVQDLKAKDLEHIESLCKKAKVKFEVFALAN